MIYNVLLILQIIVALSIIGLVLMQHGKGADAGAAFGGGASGTVFGSRGSGNFLSRATGILAAVFFVNSLLLAWLVAHRGDSALSAQPSVIPQSVVQEKKPVPEAKPPVPSDVPTAVGKPEVDTKAVAPTTKTVDTPADVPTSTAPSIEEKVKTSETEVVTPPAPVVPVPETKSTAPADVPQ